LGSTCCVRNYNIKYILFFHPALGELLDEQNHDQLIDDVRAISEEVQGVIDKGK
jgi:hypothetical protein